jgi:hypothetical protein
MKTSLSTRRRRLLPAVNAELEAADRAGLQGDSAAAFHHLERAHVLGQFMTGVHVRVHWRMLLWGLRQRRPREVTGQLTRIVGAATKTALGWLPHGNTGGANVSAFKPMPVPPDLQRQIDSALSP